MFTCICVADSQLGVDLCSDEFFMRAMEASPSVFGSWTGGLFGFTNSAVVSAVCWPNTTRSSRDSAPGRFAPWTEAQPDSPAASHPGTMTMADEVGLEQLGGARLGQAASVFNTHWFPLRVQWMKNPSTVSQRGRA